tara:strand:- start:222 stop:806 length:585 start_codon:yes stop_codon:yes gene_type:complete
MKGLVYLHRERFIELILVTKKLNITLPKDIRQTIYSILEPEFRLTTNDPAALIVFINNAMVDITLPPILPNIEIEMLSYKEIFWGILNLVEIKLRLKRDNILIFKSEITEDTRYMMDDYEQTELFNMSSLGSYNLKDGGSIKSFLIYGDVKKRALELLQNNIPRGLELKFNIHWKSKIHFPHIFSAPVQLALTL